MSKKNEKEYSQSFFYVFVDWPDPNQQPVCYIVPNAVVAKILCISGKFWYSPPRKDIGIRYLADNFHRPELSFEPEGYGPNWLEKYKERWNLLGTSAGLGRRSYSARPANVMTELGEVCSQSVSTEG
jgi:hypothetical protein